MKMCKCKHLMEEHEFYDVAIPYDYKECSIKGCDCQLFDMMEHDD